MWRDGPQRNRTTPCDPEAILHHLKSERLLEFLVILAILDTNRLRTSILQGVNTIHRPAPSDSNLGLFRNLLQVSSQLVADFAEQGADLRRRDLPEPDVSSRHTGNIVIGAFLSGLKRCRLKTIHHFCMQFEGDWVAAFEACLYCIEASLAMLCA